MKLLDIINAPWAIQPSTLRQIRDIYAAHLCGEKIDLAAVEARLGRPLQNEDQGFEVVNGNAVIPIHGIVAKRMNIFTRISGGASSQLLARDIKNALADDSVERIVLDIDSPGGTVDGTQELADLVAQAGQIKPVVAFANGLMASAAYWIGSAAGSVLVSSETTATGSIGVVATHVDVSRAEEAAGVKTTEITAGRFKRVTSQHAPLSETGRASIQAEVDHIYSIFVTAVAQNRGVDVEEVLENMAEGRIFLGSQAIEAGLADGVSSLDQLLGTELSVGDSGDSGMIPTITEVQRTETEVTTMTTGTEQPTITLGYLKENHPDLVKQIEADALATGEALGMKAGAAAERERIKAVSGQSMPGHEALIQTLMFDGETSGPEAAVKVLAAEKGGQEKRGAAIISDAPAILPAAAGNPVTQEASPSGEDGALTVKERAEATWAKDPEVRETFFDKEGYIAYREAEAKGRFKVLTHAG